MRRLVSTVAFLLGTTLFIPAATLNDVKILEASENIKYLTQNITKNYLYLYTYPNKRHLKITIQDAIKDLEKNIQTIATTTKAEKTKELLDFFAYEKERIKLLLDQKPDTAKASEFLDFSEALTEGAQSIAGAIDYNYSFEDRMFIRSKRIEYLMEKLAKYYMVSGLSIHTASINEDMAKIVTDVEKNLAKIQQYTYPKTLNVQKTSLSKLWGTSKHYYTTVNEVKIPSLVLLATQGLQNIMAQIAIHHGKGE